MPATVESALILAILIAPGFIAAQVKNELVPHRIPSPFQETIHALILSAVILPVWLLGWSPLVRAWDTVLKAWHTQAVLPMGAVITLILTLCGIYFVVAPLAGIIGAVVQIKRPHVGIGYWLINRLGISMRTAPSPEVWDKVFSEAYDAAPWLRVWFNDGTAVEGVMTHASLSPASKQLYLSGLEGVPNSLVRLDSNGVVVEDLSAKQGRGIWIEIGPEVRMVEVF